MGANVWQRDAAGSGQGTSFKTGSAAGPHPARLGKRKLVWTKDQHDQPATPAASAPQPVAHRGDLPASNSSRQLDHFEKRARLNEGFSASHNGYHRGHAAPLPQRHEDIGPLLADTRQQQTGAASQDPAAVLERRKREAELAELKRRIQQHEAQAAEHKVHMACHFLMSRICCNSRASIFIQIYLDPWAQGSPVLQPILWLACCSCFDLINAQGGLPVVTAA